MNVLLLSVLAPGLSLLVQRDVSEVGNMSVHWALPDDASSPWHTTWQEAAQPVVKKITLNILVKLICNLIHVSFPYMYLKVKRQNNSAIKSGKSGYGRNDLENLS